MLVPGVCGVVEIDIFGQSVTGTTEVVARLRELAAAEAGRSNSARDLFRVLDRALRAGAKVSLQRGEARALLILLRVPAAATPHALQVNRRNLLGGLIHEYQRRSMTIEFLHPTGVTDSAASFTNTATPLEPTLRTPHPILASR